jgi:S1-C subfamily serine protease
MSAPSAARARAPRAAASARAPLALAIVALALISPARGPETVAVRVGDDVATGFVVGDGTVVTVAHVLGHDVRVDGRPARVLRRDDRLDLAVLAADVSGPEVRLGGDDPSVVRRANASVDGSRWKRPVLELRSEVEPGDSGAPVLTSSGRLVGVVFAKSRSRPGRAWAVDASDPSVVEFFSLRLKKSTLAAPGTRR